MQHAKGESALCRAWIIKSDDQGNEHSSGSIQQAHKPLFMILHMTNLGYTTAGDGITAMIITFEVICHGKSSFFVVVVIE